jgi:hypothetical protein
MSLVGQFSELERGLPDDWDLARLCLTIPDEGDCDRAAGLLAPANPGRRGKVIRFFAARRGAGPGPDRIRALLRRLDDEGIEGELELVGTDTAEAAAPDPRSRSLLAPAWDAAVATLPPDWSDVYAEVELTSTDYLERAALLLSPVNPGRVGGRATFRFRVARKFGYGASPEMTRRCFERLDAERIRGEVRILRALSDTYPAHTQGPVWYVGGRTV